MKVVEDSSKTAEILEVQLSHFCDIVLALKSCIRDLYGGFTPEKTGSEKDVEIWGVDEGNVPESIGIMIHDPVNPRLIVLVPRGCIRRKLRSEGKSFSGTTLNKLIERVTQIIKACVLFGEDLINPYTEGKDENCKDLLQVLLLYNVLSSRDFKKKVRSDAKYILYEIQPNSLVPQNYSNIISRFAPSFEIEKFCIYFFNPDERLEEEKIEHFIKQSRIKLDDLEFFCKLLLSSVSEDKKNKD